MESDVIDPINIGSARMISVNELVALISQLAGKPVAIENVPGPRGVMGRTSDNALIQQLLGWQPQDDLESGLQKLYNWIELQRYGQT